MKKPLRLGGMAASLLDLWILVLPVCFVLVFVLVGTVFVFQVPVPTNFGRWFGIILVGNVMQLGILGVLWYRESARPGHDDSLRLWGKVLKRYLFLGGALYYLYHVRGWLLRGTDYESYRRKFWLPFVDSGLTHVMRYVNRAWIYVLLSGLLAGVVIGMLRIDFMVEILFRAVGGTIAVGVPISSYLAFVLVRDAVIRWKKSPEDRDIAMRIFSQYHWLYLFHWYLDAEAYLQAASARESLNGR